MGLLFSPLRGSSRDRGEKVCLTRKTTQIRKMMTRREGHQEEAKTSLWVSSGVIRRMSLSRKRIRLQLIMIYLNESSKYIKY
jgi:hypothetical protein